MGNRESLDKYITIYPTPSPQEMAVLLKQRFTEGEALDVLRLAGERWGWNARLNEVGCWLLKGPTA